MDNRELLKVVWICQVSNEQLREHLELELPLWRRFNSFFRGKRKISNRAADYAQWNTNAIAEFRSLDKIDLHVIFTHPNMRKKEVVFRDGGITFYAENMSDNSLLHTIKRHILKGKVSYKCWTRISRIVKRINPDIIHLMGAENSQYSLSILSLPHNVPVLVQLQTLLHAPDAVISDYGMAIQKECEYKTLMKADYIGTSIPRYATIIHEKIRDNVTIVNNRLMISEETNMSESKKQFDFVYFANSISKAVDLAIEAFGIAHRKFPKITLDIVGGATESEVSKLMARAEELGCRDAITIEGKLSTHEDVIKQIRKARFALLPLKFDIMSGTIREAIWNGIPVVTTITSGTPVLNEKRESVLLSKVGDHEGMALNMCKLIDNHLLAETLRINAVVTIDELFESNSQIAKKWVDIYRVCIDNFHMGKSIPKNIIL